MHTTANAAVGKVKSLRDSMINAVHEEEEDEKQKLKKKNQHCKDFYRSSSIRIVCLNGGKHAVQ